MLVANVRVDCPQRLPQLRHRTGHAVHVDEMLAGLRWEIGHERERQRMEAPVNLRDRQYLRLVAHPCALLRIAAIMSLIASHGPANSFPSADRYRSDGARYAAFVSSLGVNASR